ncbi:hypothetical protein LTR94_026544, partial [Friedmanniomyces endolithicus]
MGSELTRRGALASGAAIWASASIAGDARGQVRGPVEKWGVFEVAFEAPAGNSPFDTAFVGLFSDGFGEIRAPGFYDGDGIWRIRFCPPRAGSWRWVCQSERSALNGRSGQFEVVEAKGDNHGPVGVVETYHFAYADGSPFRQIGTTSYGWSHQSDAKRRSTLETLKASPFNKIRMLVLPNAAVAENLPIQPFVRTGPRPAEFDLDQLDPAFFRRLDEAVSQLNQIGIQADVILFHPYDEASGFNDMNAERDARYVRYVMARLGAYRNVWWSLANEFDILKGKTDEDWDRLFQLVRDEDPYDRLRSIHNWRRLYDNGKPWVTHSSIQNGSAVLNDATAETYRSVWQKAVIFDEVCYEGSLDERWGDLTGQEM